MTGQFFISLLNPGMGVVMAAAFVLLWVHQRVQNYILHAAASYFASAIGFFILDVLPAHPHELHRIPANLSFLLAGVFLAAAVLGRYRLPVPYATLAMITTAGFAVFCWFLLVQPDITSRIYAINFALAGVAAVMALKLATLATARFIDRLLLCLTVLVAVGFVLRPIVIFMFLGEFENYDGFQQSVYWSTVQFSQAMITIIYALILMVAVATDLIVELRDEAQGDKLSGMLNRRGFEEKAGATLAECSRNGMPVAILVADLDGFKRINDTFGHAVGDQVIMAFGKTLRSAVDEGMVAGRIGGEEFAILAPGADPQVARLLAERIRAGFKVCTTTDVTSGVDPTVSIGVYATRRWKDLYELLSNADFALYEAKRTGRDRVKLLTATPDIAVGGVASA